MTHDELISALQERDVRITTLESDNNLLKLEKSSFLLSPTPSAPNAISPEKVQAKADQLRELACRGIKSQMKWKPSCKKGTARFSYECMCDESTFRAFMRVGDKEKTKGKRMEVEEFQENILGSELETSIRYGSLVAKGKLTVSFDSSDDIMKITGGYGM